jgi:WXXGXW repeat (2 copies)
MKLALVLGGLALAASLTGCYVDGQAAVVAPVPVVTVAAAPPGAAVEVDEAPPAPQYETVAVRPGFVWIGGHWFRRGPRWTWAPGYYEHERVGFLWAPGRWEARGPRHVWVEGGWRRR